MVKIQERKRTTTGFPGIVQIRQRRDAEAFYLAKAATKTICGLFVKTETPLEKGIHVLTAVNLPRIPDPIFIDGEVVWVNTHDKRKPTGMAIKFLTIAESDRRSLDAYFRTSSSVQAPGIHPVPGATPCAGMKQSLQTTRT